jgi:hypothetical protein
MNLLLLATTVISLSADTLNFDQSSPGELPPILTSAVNKGYKPGQWRVEADATAPSPSHVLVQSDDENSGSRFPVCVLNEFKAADLELSVQFKALKGKRDQAAGLIWRYRDPENYYVVRANALENNVVLYKMENGKRSDLKPVGAGRDAYGKTAAVQKNQWNALQLRAKGNTFTVSLNGQMLFTVVDDTFSAAGQVGLWTKADSVTAFDNFSYTALKAQ